MCCFSHLRCLCKDCRGISALVGCWYSVFIKMIIYKPLNVCPFYYTALVVVGKVGIPKSGLIVRMLSVTTVIDRP